MIPSDTLKYFAAFSLGFALAYYIGKADLFETQLSFSDTALTQSEKNRESEKKSASASTSAWELEAALRADNDRLNRELDVALNRVRELTAHVCASAREDECAGASACFTNAECKRLLGESINLLGEGSKALRANAEKHDAIIKMIPR